MKICVSCYVAGTPDVIVLIQLVLVFAGSHLDAVYDVTVGYPINIPQTEADVAKGDFPKEIHFHIKRFVQSRYTFLPGCHIVHT